jgi:hypothetical protein
MRRTTNRPWICSAVLRELNAVNAISATTAREVHWWELSGVVIEAGPSYGTSGEAHAGIRRGAAMGTEGVDDHSR